MIYTLKNEILTIDISTFGAEMQSIRKDGKEYLWQGDEKNWKNKATNIFPFVGKMQDGKYIYKCKTYEMGSHGLARHIDFEKVFSSEQEIILKMQSNEQTLESYPFSFDYYIIYQLENDTIKITSKVLNKGDEPMYFALGGHPGFNLPLDDGLDITEHYLLFDEPCKVYNTFTSERGLVTKTEPFELEQDKILRLKTSLFDNDALIFSHMAKGVTLKTDKSEKGIYIRYDDMGYLGIWQTPKVAPNFLCIEPWTSLPARDGLIEDIEKQDLLCLKPKEEYKNTWSITIK